MNCSQISDVEILCGESIYISGLTDQPIEPGSILFWIYILISILLVLFAGMASGLTIGLLSIDMMSLEIFQRSGTAKEKKYAEKIIPLVKNQHLLLVTLLLSNAIAMEALPIFLDRISTPVAAIGISVTAVLLFGEIIPQALCKKFGLAIGANLNLIVRFLILILFPISYPIAKILDRVLGESHLSRFKRTELLELVNMHSTVHQGPLSIDETTVIIGALNLKNKTANDCMTPLEKVFMLEINSTMNLETVEQIKIQGHSRIPIYENDKQNIKGILLAKSLLGIDFEKIRTIRDLELRDMPSCYTTSDLYGLLNQFQEGKSHMCLVKDESEKVIGIVTLEDIIEELIQEEILDEQDLAEEYRERMKKIKNEANKYSKGLALSDENQKKGLLSKHKRVNSSPLHSRSGNERINVSPRINLDE